MKELDHNDWVFTAYVLGELTPEGMRSVEERIRRNPLLGARVAGLEATLETARQAFAGDVDTTTQTPTSKLLARMRDTQLVRAASAATAAPPAITTPGPIVAANDPTTPPDRAVARDAAPGRGRRAEVHARRATPRSARWIPIVVGALALLGMGGLVGYIVGLGAGPSTTTTIITQLPAPVVTVAAPAPAPVVAPPAPAPVVAAPEPAPVAAPPDEVVAPEPPQPEPVAVVAPEPPKPEPVTKVEVAKVEVAKPVAARVAPPHPVVTPTPAPVVAARATGVGELLVTAQPWARASVNGRPYGTVPLKLTLPVGVHTVTLSKGDRSYTSSVTVHEGAVATVSRDFE